MSVAFFHWKLKGTQNHSRKIIRAIFLAFKAISRLTHPKRHFFVKKSGIFLSQKNCLLYFSKRNDSSSSWIATECKLLFWYPEYSGQLGGGPEGPVYPCLPAIWDVWLDFLIMQAGGDVFVAMQFHSDHNFEKLIRKWSPSPIEVCLSSVSYFAQKHENGHKTSVM